MAPKDGTDRDQNATSGNTPAFDVSSDAVSDASSGQKSHLLAQMDVTMVQKLAFASAHFQLHDHARILDIGCARGLGSYNLALLNPRLHVIGMDYDASYIDEARATYRLPNLEFVQGDARALDFGGDRFDAVLNSSVMHEIYSFSGYNHAAVDAAIESQLSHLTPNGVILLRDFMRPDNPDDLVIMELPPGGAAQGAVKDLSYGAFLHAYSQMANALHAPDLRGFYLEELAHGRDGWRRFRLPHDWAYEFIWRKEYRDRFEPEAREKYGVWTAAQYRQIPESMGARVLYTAPYYNPWIVRNWHQDKVRLFRENGAQITTPPSNYIAVIQNIPRGGSQVLREHRVSAAPVGYLKTEHFRARGQNAAQGTVPGAGYDIVSRPGGVCDVIPWCENQDGRLVVYAKSGYPRPMVNVQNRGESPSLDGKTWSGHVVEPLAAANVDGDLAVAVRSVLVERAGFDAGHIGPAVTGLSYFTAASDVNEKVQSVFVKLCDAPYERPLKEQFSGFSSDGTVRAFDVMDVLRGIQVGMLAEARLELNIYALLQYQHRVPEPWIGDQFNVPVARGVKTRCLRALTPRQVFEATSEPASYLRTVRSRFVETTRDESGAQRFMAARDLEFAMPALRDSGGVGACSTNHVAIAPLLRNTAGDVLIGLQERDFPTVQAQDGQSNMLALVTRRLPVNVRDMMGLKGYICDWLKVEGAAVVPLGEAYFPSMGILPDRIFPHAVMVDRVLPGFTYYRIQDVLARPDRLQDGHALIATYRAAHALGQWQAAPDLCKRRNLRCGATFFAGGSAG